MKVLLRNTRNGLFFAGPSRWTAKRTEALDFIETEEAIQTAAFLGLEDMQLVLGFADPQDDVSLNLRAKNALKPQLGMRSEEVY
ncbi:MAG TPA: hypothetical protein VEC99_10010 [Clostridia bacterium]|nr:hypothetical protein [Clostridia bacterium]